MRLTQLVKLLDKDALLSGKIAFKLLLPLENGGKWFFWPLEGDTVEDFIKWIEDHNLNIIIEDADDICMSTSNDDFIFEFSYSEPIVKKQCKEETK